MMMRGGGQRQGNRSGRKGAGTNANKNTVRSGGNDHDDNSSIRSSDTSGSRSRDKYFETAMLGGDDQLIESVDQLTESSASRRESALGFISEYMSTHVCTELIESHSDALQTNLLSIVRKGGKPSEIQSAHDALRTLVITAGWGNQAMFDKCRLTLERAAKHGSSSEGCAAAVLTLSLLCFVCSCDEIDTKACMRLLDGVGVIASPELLLASNDSDTGSDSEADEFEQNTNSSNTCVQVDDEFVSSTSDGENEGEKQIHDPVVQEAALFAWGLLASTLSDEYIGDRMFGRYATQFLHLLSSSSNILRMEAGENIAILFEAREAAGSATVSSDWETDQVVDHIFETLEMLSKEGGAAANKKEAKEQRLAFRQIVSSVVHGEAPELKVEAEMESLEFNTWAQIRQISVMRKLLGRGLMTHLHANESLRMGLDLGECPGEITTERLSAVEKRLFLSPNSANAKDWTNNRNRERDSKAFH